MIQFYKNKGVRPERMIFFTPYPPTSIMKVGVAVTGFKNLNKIYKQMIEESKVMADEEGITCIPLDFFGDNERKVERGHIPEPTPYGAWKLSKLIQENVLS